MKSPGAFGNGTSSLSLTRAARSGQRASREEAEQVEKMYITTGTLAQQPRSTGTLARWAAEVDAGRSVASIILPVKAAVDS